MYPTVLCLCFRAENWFSAICKAGGTEGLETYKKKYVCAEHFRETDFTRIHGKLLRHSVPSQFPGNEEVCNENVSVTFPSFGSPTEVPNLNHSSVLSPASPHVLHTVKHCYYNLNRCVSADSALTKSVHENESSASNSTLNIDMKDSVLPDFNSSTISSAPTPFLASTPFSHAKKQLPFSECFPVNDTTEVLAVPLEESACKADYKSSCKVPSSAKKKSSKKKWSSFLRNVDAIRISDLTPRKAVLHKLLRSKVKALDLARKKYRKDVTRLANLKHVEKHPAVEELSKRLSCVAGKLLLSQLRCGLQKPKGRRWTLDEKTIALAVLKRSSRCYSLLRCMFHLPTKRTLTSLLNSVPFRCGVDERIFGAIEKSLLKLPEEDKFCCLVFDEMSIREHVQYSVVEDRIVGYEDDGKHTTPKMANHALVFMLRGLRTKWKQPVATFFSRGPTKGHVLKETIVNILRHCFRIGLRVVATVCDMGSNNVSALKFLGVKFPNPCFELDGHILAVMFDIPHLLKCIRNMFMSHIVRGIKVKSSDIPIVGAARWEHVEKAFEEDKKNSLYRLCPKLTESHLQPTGSDKMKVAKAAQVMSHSLAAAVHSFVSRGK